MWGRHDVPFPEPAHRTGAGSGPVAGTFCVPSHANGPSPARLELRFSAGGLHGPGHCTAGNPGRAHCTGCPRATNASTGTVPCKTPAPPTGVGPSGTSTSAINAKRLRSPTATAPSQDPTVVSWVPIGPSDRTIPPRASGTSCSSNSNATPWRKASKAQRTRPSGLRAPLFAGPCRAEATTTGSKHPSPWPTPRIPQTQCLEFRVAATSALLVAQHRSNPGALSRPSQGRARHAPGS
jgi:hypothetical protein